ncbi:MAG: hypothetical protein OXT09_05750 [Myxococcales bacterium]|nr:hypothetical protein [Myxococcales bacterium]
MHLHIRLLTACAIVAGTLLVTDSAHAGARRPGLAGSLLIEDQDDLYVFPQLLTEYRNLISLSYGDASGSGNGILTLGNEDTAFGVAVHRGDVQTPHVINEITALTGPATLFAPEFTVDPATVVDLLLGLGDLGFRLGIGSGAAITTASGNDDGETDFFIMGEVGYGTGTRGQDTRLDFSGALLLDFAKQADAGTDAFSANAFGLSGLGRMFFPMDSTLDLGLLLNASVSNTSVTDETGAMDVSDGDFDLALGGGIGPAFRLGPATVAGYGILRVEAGSVDPNTDMDDDETSTVTVVIPGVHIAAEVPIRDWLVFRTGAEYSYALNSTSSPGDVETSGRGGVFGWNAGLGVIFDQLRFDGSLEHGFVTGGPDFIGDTDPGFLAIASMSYSFDDVRSGAQPLEEPEDVTMPAPAPPPAEPAPVAPVPAPAPEPAPVAPVEPAPEPSAGGEASGSIDVGGSISTP